MQSSSSMFDLMHTADFRDAKSMVANAPIQHVQALLSTCLARLDALDEQVAAAHLSACLNSLQQHFKAD